MDNPYRENCDYKIGEDLYALSLYELQERITLYQAEITRLEAECVKKQSDKEMADAIFGKNLFKDEFALISQYFPNRLNLWL